ncbi:MAG: hypothetical protein CVV41_14405 [Candidatus Riflebacteria bacterium HGW-Riflebacteria-1]|jgi:Tfp pilus assembly protein PilV|nr:MAG: hypothetical protein CVV41_14405 [Candidatus Riflebacteria bacterium HGW-Riflebacteria-1]
MDKRGFSLAEIIVATIVMTMLMVSVIGYIQYSGEIWQDGYSKISSANYMRMATERIRLDMMSASSITQPAALPGGNATPTAMLRYAIPGVPGTYTISIVDDLLRRDYANGAASATIRLGRNVASFTATRLSSWSVQIHLEFKNDVPEEDGTYRIISSDTVTFMAPGAG